MRIDPDPKLEAGTPYGVYQLFRRIANQLNGVREGRISFVTNATTAAPTAGQWAQGDFIKNSAPVEAGVALSKYVIVGWVCTVSGTPGTWVECRCLTGN